MNLRCWRGRTKYAKEWVTFYKLPQDEIMKEGGLREEYLSHKFPKGIMLSVLMILPQMATREIFRYLIFYYIY